MKKITCIIILTLFITVSIFATSFGFGIVWHRTNDEKTTLSVMDYSGSQEISEKVLEDSIDKQNLFMIKYSTNKGGMHILKYTATPLQHEDTKLGYILYFTYEGISETLEVGDTESLYPIDSNVATVLSIPFGRGNVDNNIFVDAVIGNTEKATSGDYVATVKIERITN